MTGFVTFHILPPFCLLRQGDPPGRPAVSQEKCYIKYVIDYSTFFDACKEFSAIIPKEKCKKTVNIVRNAQRGKIQGKFRRFPVLPHFFSNRFPVRSLPELRSHFFATLPPPLCHFSSFRCRSNRRSVTRSADRFLPERESPTSPRQHKNRPAGLPAGREKICVKASQIFLVN